MTEDYATIRPATIRPATPDEHAPTPTPIPEFVARALLEPALGELGIEYEIEESYVDGDGVRIVTKARLLSTSIRQRASI